MTLSRTARFSRAISAVCGSVVVVIGAAALLGWIFGIERLRAFFVGDIVIKTNTAIGLLCLGLGLLLLEPERSNRPSARSALGRAFALLAAVIGGLTFVQHLTGLDFGIDQLLFAEPAGSPATTSPNRMGPPAAISLPLLGTALLLSDRRARRPRGIEPFQVLALISLLIALVPLLGYVFGVSELYGVARFTGIALHTSLGLTFASLGTLFARPDAGLMRRLLADSSSGLLLRRLLPAAILIPLVLGQVRLAGQEAGYYSLEFSRSIYVLSLIVVFSALTWWTGSVVERHAAAQARAEAAEREMHERLLVTLDSERTARATAERSNRMKDEFLATLSHELRTPLHAILGWVQLLVRGNLAVPDAQRGLDAIERNARLQAQLIDDLLDMSRIEAGKIRLDFQPVDLSLVVESAIAAATPAAEANGLMIERQLDPEAPVVRGDPARLQQILWNLLSNAVKFTPAGGRIVISLVEGDGAVEVFVQDSGIGIRPDLLDDVFDRFRQADPSTTRRYGGLGLGLAIARQLAEMHGGTLRAASGGEGKGATFALRLPVMAPLPVPRPPLVDGEDSGHLVEPRDVVMGARVLVVDDQADARELVARVLSERGARVEAVQSVGDALAWLEQHEADVLISDISMPGRDGYELVAQVRTRWPHLPAIALTAFVRAEDSERARAAGFSLHLPKPFSPDRLIRAVAALLVRTPQ